MKPRPARIWSQKYQKKDILKKEIGEGRGGQGRGVEGKAGNLGEKRTGTSRRLSRRTSSRLLLAVADSSAIRVREALTEAREDSAL